MPQQKIILNIEKLANQCGIKIVNCDPAFGGKWAYTEEARPGNNTVTIAGYSTKKAALKGWFEGEFDSALGRILLRDYIKGEV